MGPFGWQAMWPCRARNARSNQSRAFNVPPAWVPQQHFATRVERTVVRLSYGFLQMRFEHAETASLRMLLATMTCECYSNEQLPLHDDYPECHLTAGRQKVGSFITQTLPKLGSCTLFGNKCSCPPILSRELLFFPSQLNHIIFVSHSFLQGAQVNLQGTSFRFYPHGLASPMGGMQFNLRNRTENKG